jgi:Bacterial protein of unknown function (DUF885)
MLAQFFGSYYRLRPVNATFTGVHDYDHLLPDWSPDGLASALDEMRRLRESLPSAPASSALLADTAERDRHLAAAFLDVQIAEHDSAHFQRSNPSLAVGEAAFGVIALMTRPFAPAADRAEAAIGRLEATPLFLEGARRSLDRGIPDEWRAKSVRECGGVARLLGDGIRRWIAADAIDDRRGKRLVAAAERASAAFENFKRWVANDAVPAPSDRYACGSEFLHLLLDRGHWCRRSAQALVTEAAAALDDAVETLQTRALEVAPGGWPEMQQRLAATHPDVDGYLPAYQRAWNDCHELAISRGLVTWPDCPIRYVPIPVQTRDAAPFLYYLFYRSPAPFDRLPVHDYVVTPIDAALPPDEQRRRLQATNTSVIKLNHVVHHGAIGHHVQNYYAYHGTSEIGRVAAVDCASRIGMFLGGTMAEGWACYATDVMDDAGYFTPEESVAQQHTRARLLARAVVDIGLHTRSLSFEDGVATYRDRVGMAPEAARAEACKNSMFPGTALMYWLGTAGLHTIRRERERTEGASFSLGRFHDRVLSFGSIPVSLIAELMS